MRNTLKRLVSRRFGKIPLLLAATAAVGLMGWAAVGFADNSSGCDFAATGTTESCSGPLTGSTFAGGDGNLLTSPTTFGTTDWQNVAGLNTGVDKPSGSGDNSFGQGTKEDDPNVSVVSGSIPPSKSDLTRFYEASEFANNSNFLYLAWERTNNLGSANMDFEINQKTQPDLTTTGQKALNRTAGDLLVTFDFTNGGGQPTLRLLTWLTAAAGNTASQCFSSNTLPCWGNEVDLNSSNSIGAVNNLDAVTDPFLPGTNNIGALRFGETAINLTAAGVFPAGTCEAFGSAFLKSRSSASFPAEVKDFVAPVPVNISNCGTVNIIKHTNARGIDQTFSYTSTIPNPAAGSTTPNCSLDSTPSSFTLNDKNGVDPDPIAGTANTESCTNVRAGSYTVTEGAEPANFTLQSLTCTASGGSSGSQDGAMPEQANITVAPGGVTTCIYTNKQLTSSSSSAQGWLPNDRVVLTTNASGGLDGTLTVTLYHGTFSGTAANCTAGSATAVTNQSYTFDTSPNDVPDPSGTAYKTSNSTFYVGTNPNDGSAGGTAGDYFWLVHYVANNSTSPHDRCETSNVTITDG